MPAHETLKFHYKSFLSVTGVAKSTRASPVGNRSISQSDKLRALLIVWLCLLVFSLALSAKLSVYRDGGGACDPLVNTKLCLTGAKMDLQFAIAPLLVLWLAALTVLVSFATRKVPIPLSPMVMPVPQSGHRCEFSPRPPPALIPTQF